MLNILSFENNKQSSKNEKFRRDFLTEQTLSWRPNVTVDNASHNIVMCPGVRWLATVLRQWIDGFCIFIAIRGLAEKR